MKKLLTFLLLTGALGLTTAATAAPTDTFTATYQLTKSGIPLGSATFKLKPDDQADCYVYTGHAKPNAVVHMFIGDIDERSDFCVVDGEVRPSQFRHHIDGKPDKSYTLTFDWSAMTVKSETESGDTKSYDLKSRTQDPMSLQIAARLWLASKSADSKLPDKHEFNLADDDGIESYHVQASDGGTLKVKAGRYDTVKITRLGDHSHSMDFWMARYADWIPVRVDRMKHGKTDYTLTLQSLSK